MSWNFEHRPLVCLQSQRVWDGRPAVSPLKLWGRRLDFYFFFSESPWECVWENLCGPLESPQRERVQLECTGFTMGVRNRSLWSQMPREKKFIVRSLTSFFVLLVLWLTYTVAGSRPCVSSGPKCPHRSMTLHFVVRDALHIYCAQWISYESCGKFLTFFLVKEDFLVEILFQTHSMVLIFLYVLCACWTEHKENTNLIYYYFLIWGQCVHVLI